MESDSLLFDFNSSLFDFVLVYSVVVADEFEYFTTIYDYDDDKDQYIHHQKDGDSKFDGTHAKTTNNFDIDSAESEGGTKNYHRSNDYDGDASVGLIRHA